MLGRSSSLMLFLTTVCVLSSWASAAQELTVDEVVRRSIEAQGGQQNWDALRSLKCSGNFITFSNDAPFVLYRKPPNLYRFEHKYSDWDVIVGHDGKHSWWKSATPFVQVDWAVEPPLVRSRAIAGDAEFGGPLLHYQERGHHLELAGKVDFDGEESYLITATLANGSVEHWYLSSESMLPVARISQGADLQMEVEQKTYFSDYREVSAVLLPHLIEIELGSRYQVMEIEEIQANTEIDDRVFTMPLPAGMERLRSLEGKWEVQVSTRVFPTQPRIQTTVSSSIRARFGASLLEEDLTYHHYGSLRRVTRRRSYDRFRDVFRITSFDNRTFHLNILEGRFEDGRLIVTNLDTGTSWEAKGQRFHAREVTYDIAADSFKVEWQISTDGGESWVSDAEFIYSRKAGAELEDAARAVPGAVPGTGGPSRIGDEPGAVPAHPHPAGAPPGR